MPSTALSTKKGTVKLVFQPAEEGLGGAYHVLKEGFIDKLQAIFGLHIDPQMLTGIIGSRPGPFLVGSTRFIAKIQGKEKDGCIDPVLAAAFSILAL